MKKNSILLRIAAFAVGITLAVTGCGQSLASERGTAASDSRPQSVSVSEKQEPEAGASSEEASSETKTEGREGDMMKITVGDKVLTAVLAENSSAEALKEILSAGPLTIHMSDYGNMEKVGPIGQSLPANDEQITTVPGDIILYRGDSLVIYYDKNSWNFTRLGKIQDVTQAELKEALGEGNVTVTLSMEE